jgi:hypothetical protein
MRNRWQNTEKPKTNEDKKPMRTYNYKSEKKKPKKKNKKKKELRTSTISIAESRVTNVATPTLACSTDMA